MRRPLSPPLSPRLAQKGTSLLEVMVAVVVLSLGLLGMAGLQTRALKGSQSSLQRSQAVMLSYYALDAIRADRANAVNYTLGKTCATPTSSGSLVSATHAQWIANLKTNLGNSNNTCGTINCTPSGTDTLCTITVQWDDSRAGGSTTESIQTISRL